MTAEIADYLGGDYIQVRGKLEREIFNKGITVAEAWRRANPRTKEEVAAFYRETDAYIYDLLVDHAGIFRKTVRERVIRRLLERRCRTVLDYGGGVGEDTAEMAKAGFAVTFYEPDGLTSKFARFRFQRLGCTVRVVTSVDALPAGSYDAAVCIEVLEHVPDPVAVIRDLRHCLKVGGVTFVTESFSALGEDYPAHLPSNARFRGKIFSMMEGQGFGLVHRWPDNKPLEFVRAAGRGALLRCRWRRRAILLRYVLGRGWRALRQVI